MARCSGCSSDRCSCVIRPGANISVTGVGTPNNPYVISSQGDEGQAVPSGSLVMYAGDVMPAGWLLCNGTSVSRTAYAALFAAIGTAYGAGDGSSTFAIPDLRDRMPVGTSASKARGTMGGVASTTLTMAHIPQHSHTIAHTHDASHNHSASSGAVNLDHGHHFVVGGGGHEHNYEANIARQQYTSGGSFGAVYTGYTAGTTGGGGHTHEGDTWGVAGGLNHAHSVTVDTRSFSTGGASTGSSGNAGSAAPDAISTVPPWTSVNFIIKT